MAENTLNQHTSWHKSEESSTPLTDATATTTMTTPSSLWDSFAGFHWDEASRGGNSAVVGDPLYAHPTEPHYTTTTTTTLPSNANGTTSTSSNSNSSSVLAVPMLPSVPPEPLYRQHRSMSFSVGNDLFYMDDDSSFRATPATSSLATMREETEDDNDVFYHHQPMYQPLHQQQQLQGQQSSYPLYDPTAAPPFRFRSHSSSVSFAPFHTKDASQASNASQSTRHGSFLRRPSEQLPLWPQNEPSPPSSASRRRRSSLATLWHSSDSSSSYDPGPLSPSMYQQQQQPFPPTPLATKDHMEYAYPDKKAASTFAQRRPSINGAGNGQEMLGGYGPMYAYGALSNQLEAMHLHSEPPSPLPHSSASTPFMRMPPPPSLQDMPPTPQHAHDYGAPPPSMYYAPPPYAAPMHPYQPSPPLMSSEQQPQQAQGMVFSPHNSHPLPPMHHPHHPHHIHPHHPHHPPSSHPSSHPYSLPMQSFSHPHPSSSPPHLETNATSPTTSTANATNAILLSSMANPDSHLPPNDQKTSMTPSMVASAAPTLTSTPVSPRQNASNDVSGQLGVSTPASLAVDEHHQQELGKGLPLARLAPNTLIYTVEFKAGRIDYFYVAEPPANGTPCPSNPPSNRTSTTTTEAASYAAAAAASLHHANSSSSSSSSHRPQHTRTTSSAGAALRPMMGDLVIVEADRGKDLGKVAHNGIPCSQLIDQMANNKQTHPFDTSSAPSSASNDVAASPNAAAHDSNTAQQPQHTDAGSAGILVKRIFRLAAPDEINLLLVKGQDEQRALVICQQKIKQRKLQMEVVDAEYQWDRRKLTFYFNAEKRIDFRDLVREMFKIYKTRIWMCAVNNKRTALMVNN
ncbi:PSP1 C-terminal conserved region-domain-containing protein [Gongronella butleri]|nr:PSP1 C-terminal conserved region-domain-containing protein [Gongronella butleri]